MKRNILLTIAYDGSGFHGWQRQPGVRTVQGHLEQVMSRTFGREIQISGTSRTDAGVHAFGQRATLKTDIGVPIEKLAMVVNNALHGAEGNESGRGGFARAPVRILKAEEMPEDFHARFSCKGKKYIYRINCGAASDKSLVFERNYIYHVDKALDADAMKEAAAYLVGTHDFRSFEASGGNPRQTTVRTIFGADIISRDIISRDTISSDIIGGDIAGMNPAADERLELHISGDGFLYNMVRIITGTLVEMGQGRRSPEDMKKILGEADRTAAGHTAPPNGLYLAEVYY